MNYKEDCIKECLDFIQSLFEDMLDFTDNPDEKLLFLYHKVEALYRLYENGSDMQQACYNVTRRKLQEAMDWPIEKLTPLLMENINTPKGRHVSQRFYYKEAGK